MDKEFFREIRIKCGFTQKQFAEFFDIPIGTVRNWEQGISNCPGYVLKLIIYRLEIEGFI